MLLVRLVIIAALFVVGLQASIQEYKTVQFGHGNVGYRVVETVEPVREKRDTTTSNSTSTTSILECYQFTWPGVSENNTVPDCARIKKYVPCFTPFVFTNDTSSPEPDPAIVKDYCDTRGCKVTCPKTNTNSCIRYAYYSAGQAVNVTYFCGAVQDRTNDVPLKQGGFTDTKSGGLIVDVNYCQGNLCNSANPMQAPIFFMFALMAAIVLFR
ncbi:uncharacterized protein LOC124349999 [Daphnia pulicaria]|uniref:uncharacterized protein LOC124349999 n=1 Tax=Daphnia pulicaria TaxID=35523 RepID=UPI001EEB2632|nr:uncharacterized protein LOC124349999 [Daphnia pulicaria]